MTPTKKVSTEDVVKSREELLEECLELGIPVTGNEDIDTLKLYLASSDDDDDFEDEDEFEEDDEFEDEEAVDDEEIFEEDLDFDEDEDDLFEDDDEAPYN